MRVLLVDVDSTIPNLALMKISKFHKDKGDSVRLLKLSISYYPNKRKMRIISNFGYDKTYISTIFSGSMNFVKFDELSNCESLTIGGTGFDLTINLPDEIENKTLDYSIYPDNDTAYGFISRGCNRKCYFCVVPKKEGKTKQVETDLMNIIREFKKVKFMDNNFLQLPNHVEILKWLSDRKIKCQFNQGLDIRLINEENSIELSKLNYIGEYVFAFDDWGYRRIITRKMELLNWIRPWGAKFFVYVHPDMELNKTIKRVEFLRERKLLPYIMRDRSCWGSENELFYTDLAAYVNQPGIFKKMIFTDFLLKRHKNFDRILDSADLYKKAM